MMLVTRMGVGVGLGVGIVEAKHTKCVATMTMVSMRDRSKNRKPLQKGRSLSIEAIQTVQALKRAAKLSHSSLEEAFVAKFKRLLKSDMIAVLRELLRQNQCLLALKVTNLDCSLSFLDSLFVSIPNPLALVKSTSKFEK